MGTLDEFDTLARQLAERMQTCVVPVDYRLAPEHPFPTAVHDAWTGLRWVVEYRTAIGAADGPLIVAGDSAGENSPRS